MEETEVQKPDIVVEGVSVPGNTAEEAVIKSWTKRIKDARTRFKPDFDRMRENMEFAFGIQWKGQKDLRDDRYQSNMTNRAVNQKVATLYARDPKAVYRRRKRLEYEIWDEKLESLAVAIQRTTLAVAGQAPPDAESMAIVADYERGQLQKMVVDRVGRTLEVVYQYQVDTQEPGFKTQMKQLVRRVVTCGVGYVSVSFESEQDVTLNSTSPQATLVERSRQLQALVERFSESSGDTQNEDAEQIRLLSLSIMNSLSQPGPEREGLVERLVFDFIPATAIIPDPACRCLKGFVGAHWLVHEMILPAAAVNAFFETEVKPGVDGAKSYDSQGEQETSEEPQEECEKRRVCLWHVYDLDTKSHFYIVDGHKRYVQAPEPVAPAVRGFFPIAALTFNETEVEEDQKATIFPPSDVELMRHPQREWNRTRDGLRGHRKARAPKWVVPKGVLSEDDLAAIANARGNQVIELESVTKGDDMSKILMAFPHEAIDPAVYDTKVLADDIMFAVGTQEANLGPAKANVTATVGSIAEQSRMTMSSSNVDDLDDFLSTLARLGGEMLMREMSKQTVMRIAGPGAAWPEANRDDFLNSIYLETVAASSGRPNKAMEQQNAREIGPLLLQAGANPMFLVREFVKRWDDRLDPEEAFPLMPQMSASRAPTAPQPATPAGGPQVNPPPNQGQ